MALTVWCLWREKIIIPQLGNEPGTWLSFRCSTNWATKESMLSHLHKMVTVQWPYMLCTDCPYRLVTYDLWFEGLPPCIKVHLDCLATYVKDCHMTIDGSDSLVPVERKNHNSSARKMVLKEQKWSWKKYEWILMQWRMVVPAGDGLERSCHVQNGG